MKNYQLYIKVSRWKLFWKSFLQFFFKVSFILFWIFLFIYIIGFIFFIDFLPAYQTNKSDNANTGKKNDAIVVLTGGSERIPEGLKMLENNYADLLFISGLYTEKSLEHYKKNLSQFEKISEDKIHFDTVARTTIENAEQVRNWAVEHGVKSIYLTTSYYHIPRAKYLIQKFTPDLKIVSHPVFPLSYDNGGTLESMRIFSLVFFEYNKYILSNILIMTGLI
ncbi:MAG: YdcF family protein [Rickettsiales bacterium]|jgi:uncharacterized SAM-binding protein YcdF (DUF218 family)|nr:YdcF family protein [Rickettsiales bacterium]